MTYDQYQKYIKEYNVKYKQVRETVKSHIEKIQKDPKTIIVKYPEYLECFNYIKNLFPNFDIDNVVIYIVNRRILEKMGYKGVGGFFEKILKTIVIPDNLDFSEDKNYIVKGKITIDEVIVHELLHYVSDNQNKKITSVELEEEFAYGNSIGYLRKKGYSDIEIVKNNFLPFLVGTIDNKKVIKEILIKKDINIDIFKVLPKKSQDNTIKKYKKEINEEIIKKAIQKGMEIIELYSDNKKEIKIDNGLKNFDMMDF